MNGVHSSAAHAGLTEWDILSKSDMLTLMSAGCLCEINLASVVYVLNEVSSHNLGLHHIIGQDFFYLIAV